MSLYEVDTHPFRPLNDSHYASDEKQYFLDFPIKLYQEHYMTLGKTLSLYHCTINETNSIMIQSNCFWPNNIYFVKNHSQQPGYGK